MTACHRRALRNKVAQLCVNLPPVRASPLRRGGLVRDGSLLACSAMCRSSAWTASSRRTRRGRTAARHPRGARCSPRRTPATYPPGCTCCTCAAPAPRDLRPVDLLAHSAGAGIAIYTGLTELHDLADLFRHLHPELVEHSWTRRPVVALRKADAANVGPHHGGRRAQRAGADSVLNSGTTRAGCRPVSRPRGTPAGCPPRTRPSTRHTGRRLTTPDGLTAPTTKHVGRRPKSALPATGAVRVRSRARRKVRHGRELVWWRSAARSDQRHR